MSNKRNPRVNLNEIEGPGAQDLSTDEAEKVRGGMGMGTLSTTSPVISRPSSGGTSGNTTQSTTVGGETFQTPAPGPRTP